MIIKFHIVPCDTDVWQCNKHLHHTGTLICKQKYMQYTQARTHIYFLGHAYLSTDQQEETVKCKDA